MSFITCNSCTLSLPLPQFTFNFNTFTFTFTFIPLSPLYMYTSYLHSLLPLLTCTLYIYVLLLDCPILLDTIAYYIIYVCQTNIQLQIIILLSYYLTILNKQLTINLTLLQLHLFNKLIKYYLIN